MLFCIQCALRALLKGEDPQKFDETMAEHIRRVHPDPQATLAERRELEEAIAALIRRTEMPTSDNGHGG